MHPVVLSPMVFPGTHLVKHHESQSRTNGPSSKNKSHNNSHRNHTNRIFYKHIFRLIHQSLHPMGPTVYAMNGGFLCIRYSGHRGNKITVHVMILNSCSLNCLFGYFLDTWQLLAIILAVCIVCSLVIHSICLFIVW